MARALRVTTGMTPRTTEPRRARDLDPAHDPGLAAAGERARRAGVEEATVVTPRAGGRILLGTAGWTDPTLTAGGVFYPRYADTPEERLRYYASRFPFVEVDSTYYALPARRMAELWAERTPPEFTFNVKANALMTGHPTEVKRLPKAIRDALPADLAAKTRVYAKDLPPELVDAVWETFVDALQPLHSSGKLGAVLLQYPRWFVPSRRNAEALLDAKRRLGDVAAAVEFRNRRWLSPALAGRTLALLAEHDLPFVMVDEPQGFESSVPPLVAAPSPRLAVVRFHGRRAATWERPNVPVTEKFRYLYGRDELAEWVPKILEAAAHAKETHVVFNNCYGNYGTTNALEMTELLRDAARGTRHE